MVQKIPLVKNIILEAQSSIPMKNEIRRFTALLNSNLTVDTGERTGDPFHRRIVAIRMIPRLPTKHLIREIHWFHDDFLSLVQHQSLRKQRDLLLQRGDMHKQKHPVFPVFRVNIF
jgi:hypothetical protein